MLDMVNIQARNLCSIKMEYL